MQDALGTILLKVYKVLLYFVFIANESMICVEVGFRSTVFVLKILRILYWFTFTHHYC